MARTKVKKHEPWTKPDSGQPFLGKKQHGSKRFEDVTAERRARVAALLEKNMNVNEITLALSNPNSEYYMENPNTLKPYIQQTISQDIAALYGRSFTAERIAARRELVRALRIRGLSMYEILNKMSDPRSKSYTVNPDTGQPYDEETIRDDLQKIREANYVSAMENTNQHRATQLAELDEVKRAGWAIGGEGGLRIVLRAIEITAKLTGTEAPNVNINVNSKGKDAHRALRDKISLMMEVAAVDVDVADMPELPEVVTVESRDADDS